MEDFTHLANILLPRPSSTIILGDLKIYVDILCLGLLRLLKQNTIDWVAYKQQKFIPHSSKAGKSKIKAPVDLVPG